VEYVFHISRGCVRIESQEALAGLVFLLGVQARNDGLPSSASRRFQLESRGVDFPRDLDAQLIAALADNVYRPADGFGLLFAVESYVPVTCGDEDVAGLLGEPRIPCLRIVRIGCMQ
jgi:hypothetical protein